MTDQQSERVTWRTLPSALSYQWRAGCCEILTGWALKIAPPGYVPGMVLACIDAFKRKGRFAAYGERPEK